VKSAPASVVAAFPFINAQTIPSSAFTVNPRDTVIATVTYVTHESGATTGGHVSILNTSRTTQNFFSLALPVPTGAQANGASAEWIVECPGGGEAGQFGQPALSLAKFTPIDFTGALACNCNASLSEVVWGDPSAASLVNIETDTTPSTVLTATNPGTGTATITFVGG
jgi:Peptidase A4 family